MNKKMFADKRATPSDVVGERTTRDLTMTRGEQRAAHKMLMILQDGCVVVGDFADLAVRYQNYRKIPKHTTLEKELLEYVVGVFLGNVNWLEESRTYAKQYGNAKSRMRPFFLDALEERAEKDAKTDEEVIWEDIRNENNKLISWVTPSGPKKAHDFWFATNEDYAHSWSMKNDEKYYHNWMMENDEDYKAAYEAEQARLEKEKEEKK